MGEACVMNRERVKLLWLIVRDVPRYVLSRFRSRASLERESERLRREIAALEGKGVKKHQPTPAERAYLRMLDRRRKK